MFDQTTFDADLQALADKHQVHITGKATPVNPEVEAFDITAQAQPVADTAAGSDTTGTGTADASATA